MCERMISTVHPSASIILRGRCLNHVCERVPSCTKCKYYPKRTMLKSRVWEGPLIHQCKYYPKRTMLERITSTVRVPHPGASIILRGQCLNHVCERVHSRTSASIILRGRCLNHVCERVPSASKCKYYPNRTMLKSRVCEGPLCIQVQVLS